MDRPTLRRELRTARANMGEKARREASRRIVRNLLNSPLYLRARHISAFWPLAGEVDLRELLGTALRHGKRCYLPVMLPGRLMRFARFRSEDDLKPNWYGIQEIPFASAEWLAPRFLDLVCVPLLGFDANGNRLGAGGGYYDRTFAFKQRESGKPRFVGVAFACQQLAGGIEAQAWDVPLEGVVTEKGFVGFPRSATI